MGKKAHKKNKTAERNNNNLQLGRSKYSDSESPHIEDEQPNEASDKIIDQQDLFNKRECALKEEVTRLKD